MSDLILEALWASWTDIVLTLVGVVSAAVGITVEMAERRRLSRMARDREAGRARANCL